VSDRLLARVRRHPAGNGADVGVSSVGPGLRHSPEEAARLRALARYAILDTPPDESFDDIAELAREVTRRPVAGIAFSASDRVWFKSLVGGELASNTRELFSAKRPPSLRDVVLEFATRDVHPDGLVAVPCVTSDGYTLGCLFVGDDEPFELDHRQASALAALARQVTRLLELRRTLLAYHTVVDKAGHVVFHLDQTDQLVSLTPTWSQLSGFGVVRSLGARLQDFVHPEDHRLFDSWLEQVRINPIPPVVQCRLVRLGAEEVMVEMLARPLVDERDRALGVVGIIANVSDRHARELEAQHLSKLEALGRLSAGLAHEINTPIQFVGDNARFLAECYETMLELLGAYRKALDPAGEPMARSERQLQMERAEAAADIEYLSAEVPLAIQQSLEGVERVASLVRAMKTFSHPGSTEQSPADLNEALCATVTVARNQFRYIAEAELDLGPLPPVVCNIGDLNQVFLNLVVNAADAIEETGEFGRITISTRVDGDDVVVSVGDTGVGVPEALKRQIFEPFFTTKQVGRGTGQGLALVRAIVDKHAGAVSVESVPGFGTTFDVRLPIHGTTTATGAPA
jgi:signal transduction histidine kinase